MLNLTRRKNEWIQIGNDIRILVTRIKGGQVGLGITAPKELAIVRLESPTSCEGGPRIKRPRPRESTTKSTKRSA